MNTDWLRLILEAWQLYIQIWDTHFSERMEDYVPDARKSRILYKSHVRIHRRLEKARAALVVNGSLTTESEPIPEQRAKTQKRGAEWARAMNAARQRDEAGRWMINEEFA